MQLNSDAVVDNTRYGQKLNALLKDTPLDAYLHGNVINNINMTFYKAPKNRRLYAQFDCGYIITIVEAENVLYALKRIDKSKLVFTDKPKDIYKRCYVINKSKRNVFAYLDKMYKTNCVKYEDQRVYYEAMKIFALLGIA